MLTEFFESPVRIQELRDGPDGRLLEGFAQELCQAGDAEITARRHIRAAPRSDAEEQWQLQQLKQTEAALKTSLDNVRAAIADRTSGAPRATTPQSGKIVNGALTVSIRRRASSSR